MVWQPDANGTFFDADYDDKTGNFTYTRAVDVAPVINENQRLRTDEQNGFFKESREGRHIGEIPELVYYRDVAPVFRKFEQDFKGDELRVKKGDFLRKFLTANPAYLTVEAIVTHRANEGNIVVK